MEAARPIVAGANAAEHAAGCVDTTDIGTTRAKFVHKQVKRTIIAGDQ